MTYQLSKPSLGKEEREAIYRVMESGYLGMGPEVARFEEELKKYIGTPGDVVCTSNCTSALHLACQALGLGKGDEVLVPSLTYVATFQAVSASGATPIACDVYPESALLDLEDASRRISHRTKAIVYVHYGSNPGNQHALYEFANRNGLRVIEDAAHSFGCTLENKKIGSFGDITCFSFDPIKNITSIEGGAVVSSDSNVTDSIRRNRRLAIDMRGGSDFDVLEQGWRYHMSDCMAAVGRVQLARLDAEFAPHRKALGKRYEKNLSSISNILPVVPQSENIVPHIYPIRVLSHRDKIVEALEAANCQYGFQYKPNHLLSLYGKNTRLPGAERFYTEVLCLPIQVEITESAVDNICKVIKDSCRETKNESNPVPYPIRSPELHAAPVET